jgi:hypothetical protein
MISPLLMLAGKLGCRVAHGPAGWQKDYLYWANRQLNE